MTKSLLFIAASAAALLSSPLARADEAPDLSAVIVTANRIPTPVDEVSASVTVIDAATLATRQTVILSDVLAQTPGLTVGRNGGPGQTTTVRIRGAESEQTVVVVDGVRVNDPASPGGGYDFSNLLAGDIARIEILRGPSSTLWGADAIGGVINITTATPSTPLSVSGAVEAGSNDTRYVRANAGGVADRLTWRIGGGYYETGGVSAFDARLGGKEPDGALNASGSAALSYRLSPWASVEARLATVAAKTAFDGFPPPNYSFADTSEYGESRETTGSLGLNLSAASLAGLGGALQNHLSVHDLRLDRDNYDPTQTPKKTFYARGQSRKLAWQGAWSLTPAIVAVAGLDSQRDTIRTAAPASYDPDPAPLKAHVTLDSGFVSGRATVLPGLTLSAGLREDHHSQFGDHTTASAGAAYTPDGGVTDVRASFGQGFKAPTLYQLYGDYGFTGLRPETANGIDAGVSRKWFGGQLETGVALFAREVRDQIGFFSCYPATLPQCATRPYGFYANIDRTRASGAELQATARLTTHLSVTANYTFTDTENRSSGSNRGKDLPRRPRDLANVQADWRLANGASLSAGVRYAGESFDDLGNARRLKAYTLADLRGEYPVSPQLSVYARVENLFDQAYETAYRYGSVGRAAYLGLRVRY